MDGDRYSRQILFHEIGVAGQKKLLSSKVAIIGMGALGTVIANNLCRSGVGFIRLIDRDYVEFSNLQRQTLFCEEDARQQTPKAVAAYEQLKKVNSDIALDAVVADINASNIQEHISDVDLIVDGSDNFEVRYLINEACVKNNIPWIYGGALSGSGATMNIIPGTTPCFRCFYPVPPAHGSYQTCNSAGVLNMITGLIACIESAEAIKMLIGSPDARKTLMLVDIWNNSTDYIEITKHLECPVCAHHQFEYLGHLSGTYTTSLCGRDSIQVVPGTKADIDFEFTAERLKLAGSVKYNRFMLSFSNGTTEFDLFPDGRAIIKKVKDVMAAKSVYSEYIGM